MYIEKLKNQPGSHWCFYKISIDIDDYNQADISKQ